MLTNDRSHWDNPQHSRCLKFQTVDRDCPFAKMQMSNQCHELCLQNVEKAPAESCTPNTYPSRVRKVWLQVPRAMVPVYLRQNNARSAPSLVATACITEGLIQACKVPQKCHFVGSCIACLLHNVTLQWPLIKRHSDNFPPGNQIVSCSPKSQGSIAAMAETLSSRKHLSVEVSGAPKLPACVTCFHPVFTCTHLPSPALACHADCVICVRRCRSSDQCMVSSVNVWAHCLQRTRNLGMSRSNRSHLLE